MLSMLMLSGCCMRRTKTTLSVALRRRSTRLSIAPIAQVGFASVPSALRPPACPRRPRAARALPTPACHFAPLSVCPHARGGPRRARARALRLLRGARRRSRSPRASASAAPPPTPSPRSRPAVRKPHAAWASCRPAPRPPASPRRALRGRAPRRGPEGWRVPCR